MIKKYLAFTLTEVLLVATIIGVIGALTVPNIKKNNDEKALYSRARASMAKLEAALQQVELSEVLAGKSTAKDWSAAVLNGMENHLKLHEKCGSQSNSNYCFTKTAITSIGDTNPVTAGDACATAILNDGTEFAVCITSNSPSNNANMNTTDYYGYIAIDVDGAQKGDNTRGKDIFVFGITSSGLVVDTTKPEATVLLNGKV